WWIFVFPSEKRLVPSGMTPLPCVARIAVHRFVFRLRHDLQLRHSGVYRGITWSPFFTLVTPGPTSTTTPAPSCPKITGNNPSGSWPESVNASVWHTPVALISTSTSPAFGPSSSTSSIMSGFPASYATAALVFMVARVACSAHGGRGSVHAAAGPRGPASCCSVERMKGARDGARPSPALAWPRFYARARSAEANRRASVFPERLTNARGDGAGTRTGRRRPRGRGRRAPDRWSRVAERGGIHSQRRSA